DLRLADAHGLDQHDVVARRLAHENGLAGPACDATERSPRRAGPDERFRRDGQTGHARLVPEDAAAGAGARRIHGQHGNALPVPDEVEPEGLDEGALPRTRHTGHADTNRAPGPGQDLLEQPLRPCLVVGARALDQRDRLGERPPIGARAAPRDRLALTPAGVWRPVTPTTAVPRPAEPARQILGHPRPNPSPPTSIPFPPPARLPRRLRRSRHDVRTGHDVARSLSARPETKSRAAINSSTRRAAFGTFVPGPKIALTPACSSNR